MELDLLKFKWRHQMLCLFVCALILLLYGQTSDYDFVDLDDPHYVSYNKFVQQGLSLEGVHWAFSFKDKGGSYWQPLTWISHMADVTLFGNQAGCHHLVNVLWHILNTCLLFFFLRLATGSFWSSSLVALLFAVHPMNVESVAWISERKNLLSSFFWFATLLAYVSYAKSPGTISYLALIALFCLGLMVKPMLVTLPFVLILMDYWPLERIKFNGVRVQGQQYNNVKQFMLLCLEKLPFVFLAFMTAYLVTESMSEYRNAVSFSDVSLRLRIDNLFVSYVTYIGKMFWPTGLGVFHSYPSSLTVQNVFGSLAVLGSCSFIVLFPLRQKKYLTFGWLWFLGTLVPVSGIIQAGIWPSWAERWAYIPYVGLFVMLSWSIRDIMHRYKRKPLIFFIIVCFVIMQGILGRHQVKQWQNSATLYQNTITTDSSNTFAVMGLANALAAKGLSEKAAVHYFRAFELDFNKVINGQLGSVALTRENLNKLAIETYITAQQKNSSLKKTDYYKGLSYTHLKRYDDAISCFTKELQTYKEQPKTTNALAIVYDRIGDSGNASMYFKKTIQYNPFDLSFENFADVLMRTGNFKEATSYYQLAVKRNPENEEILLKLAEALMVTGKYREAFLSTMDAISIKPDRTKIRSQFVNIFIKQRQTEEAVFRALMEAQRGDLSQSRLEDISQKLENYTKIEEKMFSLLKYIVTLETTRTHPSVLKAKTRNELIEKIINMHLTVLGTNPEHFEITINLAQLYTQLGDRERSIYYYKKALQIDPDNADLHFNLANLLTAEEQNEEAITHYEKALEIQPSFLYALNNLGILLAKNNKAERAIVYFTKALSLDPSFVDGHKSMGVIYYQRGNKDKAILHFQKAVDLAPDNQNIQLMLERVQSM